MTTLLEKLRAATDENREIDAQPSKRWFNWWNVLAPIDLYVRGQYMGPQEPGIRRGCTAHPSKDLAEQVAVNGARNNPETFSRLEYLGAFPEGERP